MTIGEFMHDALWCIGLLMAVMALVGVVVGVVDWIKERRASRRDNNGGS